MQHLHLNRKPYTLRCESATVPTKRMLKDWRVSKRGSHLETGRNLSSQGPRQQPYWDGDGRLEQDGLALKWGFHPPKRSHRSQQSKVSTRAGRGAAPGGWQGAIWPGTPGAAVLGWLWPAASGWQANVLNAIHRASCGPCQGLSNIPTWRLPGS